VLARGESERRPMVEAPRLFLSIRRLVVWAMRNRASPRAKLTVVSKLGQWELLVPNQGIVQETISRPTRRVAVSRE